MPSPELTELSKNLATQNNVTTPAPAAPTTAPEGVSGNAAITTESAGGNGQIIITEYF